MIAAEPQTASVDRQTTDRRNIARQTTAKAGTTVTTSWDDGHRADLRLAELLRSKDVRGTFYIPIHYAERSLENSALKDLASEGFEIGAHGFSHKLLRGLSSQELTDEIQPCRPILEDIIGKPVQMFCYPCGRYDAEAVRTLQQAGYRGARTTRMLATRPDFNPFAIPTTVQIFPHRPLTYLKNVARAGRLEGFKAYVAQRRRLGTWLELGKTLFDSALQNGGVWHLYGHSWEIDRLGLWDDLRELLDYVSRRDGVRYVPNCELVPASANGRH